MYMCGNERSTIMENLVKQSSILEKSGVYSEDGKHRYELSLIYKGIKGKKILVISMNPASSDLMVMDTTSNYLLNNLGVMGYSEIVVWNLFSDVCVKLKPSDTTLEDEENNNAYLKELLKKKKFDTIMIGYGSGFNGSKKVEERKKRLFEIIKPYEEKLFELIDTEEKYAALKDIHPLFAGQRFSGKWGLRKYGIKEEIQ